MSETVAAERRVTETVR